MDKVHVGHMCVCVFKMYFLMEFIACFTFGIHWFTYFYILELLMKFPRNHGSGQLASVLTI